MPDPTYNQGRHENLHPELLSVVPPQFHEEFVSFVDTAQGSAEFCSWLDESPQAMQVLDSVFANRNRHWALQHQDRVERTGGVFQAGEEIAERLGTGLNTGLMLSKVWSDLAKQMKAEQLEIDGESSSEK